MMLKSCPFIRQRAAQAVGSDLRLTAQERSLEALIGSSTSEGTRGPLEGTFPLLDSFARAAPSRAAYATALAVGGFVHARLLRDFDIPLVPLAERETLLREVARLLNLGDSWLRPVLMGTENTTCVAPGLVSPKLTRPTFH